MADPGTLLDSIQSFLVNTQNETYHLLIPTRPSISNYIFPTALQVRYASHATQGRANAKARDPAGKRLGAKKSGEQYVVPGNIIFKQRGTKWFPGENCGMGRDHTIYATEAGYVKYYRDPELHPKRRYIGVCFERDGTLPTPRNAPTRRRLNMIAVPRVEEPVAVEQDLAADVEGDRPKVFDVESAVRAGLPDVANSLPLRPGYMYREANWQIGRAGDKAGITAEKFDRKNRWLAWRKRQARAQRAAQMKSLKGKKKAGKKGKGR
ncbi:50S ribosomal protein L27, putative [Talaromyces stipitatus ATCC 10500]|uniref:Large ribosomal subunit protein bL27m n=1 Tax=Talaromyces stipitatus (strain ATCC 10500 / CBS 375.48 / QM 6759 / NRRL 1006) TaxID=441959 RepID=B8M9R0_TALSN|nr:50S ribosomal protein L27, putative [Talaromyces stipitatus ATCC 10500]EED18062.1 50S ribosomal protein L27, putative [Talaromyces stipitatus ATCC 10500]